MTEFDTRADSVDVTRLMARIRRGIREQRGPDDAERRARELAEVTLDRCLEPRRAGSDVVEHNQRLTPPGRFDRDGQGRSLAPEPFEFDELCARIHSLVRRRFEQKNPCLEVGPLRIDTVRREVKCGGHPIHLTPSEYKILHALALRPRQTFSKAVLMDRLYRSDADVTDNVIEVLVSNLRKKIRSPDEPPLIVTRRGYGYQLVPPHDGW